MINEIIKGRFFFVVLAVLVNGLILMMIPQLSHQENYQHSKPFFNAIFVTKYEPPPPPPLHPKRERPRPEEKKPETLPKVSLKQRKVHTQPPRMNFEVPDVSFEINPTLKTGMAIAPPPVEQKPEPVVQQAPSQPVPVTRSVPSEFGMDEVDEKPRVLQKVEPVYPYRARRRDIKGMVTVKFLVSVSGDVTKPSVVEAKPRGVFEQSVLEAIRRWRFKPGYFQGKAVPTWVILPIQFNLNS
ncbi:energy transducer TonB [Desulfonema magnum]|uniref:TonB family C-terminal domain-containing protein n=1 Tax=Desulfonema magnum TaxID=45655 RepID=A0A975BI13_9BACT|nr:energy transducer TonB [Desulfonema magnum]QTA85882.1 TonB family C-terminal domain-containing protein [Desulfonema magnum]